MHSPHNSTSHVRERRKHESSSTTRCASQGSWATRQKKILNTGTAPGPRWDARGRGTSGSDVRSRACLHAAPGPTPGPGDEGAEEARGPEGLRALHCPRSDWGPDRAEA